MQLKDVVRTDVFPCGHDRLLEIADILKSPPAFIDSPSNLTPKILDDAEVRCACRPLYSVHTVCKKTLAG